MIRCDCDTWTMDNPTHAAGCKLVKRGLVEGPAPETKVGSTVYHVTNGQLVLIKLLAKNVKLPWQCLAARPNEAREGLKKWFEGRRIRFQSFGDVLDGTVREVLPDGHLRVGTGDQFGTTEAIVKPREIKKVLGRAF